MPVVDKRAGSNFYRRYGFPVSPKILLDSILPLGVQKCLTMPQIPKPSRSTIKISIERKIFEALREEADLDMRTLSSLVVKILTAHTLNRS
jgi:hypothetical protein